VCYEYRVIAERELVKSPSVWQSPSARAKQYAAALEGALSRMGDEGWQLVESHKEPWSGNVYFIFQRESLQEQSSERCIGIRVMQRGARE
jgi:hypothetical protein